MAWAFLEPDRSAGRGPYVEKCCQPNLGTRSQRCLQFPVTQPFSAETLSIFDPVGGAALAPSGRRRLEGKGSRRTLLTPR